MEQITNVDETDELDLSWQFIISMLSSQPGIGILVNEGSFDTINHVTDDDIRALCKCEYFTCILYESSALGTIGVFCNENGLLEQNNNDMNISV